VLIFTVIDYLALSDCGLKQALMRFIPKLLGQKKTSEINRIMSSATVLYLGVATLTLLLGGAFVYYLGDLFEFSSLALLDETAGALGVIVLQLAFALALTPLAGSFGAFHRYDIIAKTLIVEEIARFGVLVYLLWHGHGLVSLAWAIFIISALRQIVSIYILRRIHPEISLKTKDVNRNSIRSLVGYSRIAFLITVLWLVIVRADAFILGGIIGLAAVGVYAPAAQIIHHVRNIINAIGIPLTPAISHFESTGASDKLADIYLKGVRYVSFFSMFSGMGIALYAKSFVALWLPQEFALAGDVMVILAIPAAVYMPQIIGNSILYGIERHSELLRILAIEMTTKVLLSIYLVEHFGLIGLAFGTAAPQILLYGIYYPFMMKRTIGASPLKFYVTFLTSGFLGALVVAIIYFSVRFIIAPDTWIGFSVNVLAALALAAPAGWKMLREDDRLRLKEFLRESFGSDLPR
ncbi:MAG: oligosaccharide flippase family protein, partial [candidate division Zixibacteria bacterium]|nr:oligosaccharide flippase family protein [candidate division Zixibacteria bacterium]